MKYSEFVIGGTFWCSDQQWQCTDIGTRTIIAMRIDPVEVGSNVPELRRTLTRAEAEKEGWFKGPPYAGAEVVFDEDYMLACSREPDAEVQADVDAVRKWQLAAIEEGIEAAQAGRLIPHEDVVAWFESRREPNKLPCPQPTLPKKS